jgi:capsular polysaccharide biosynthesis protein
MAVPAGYVGTNCQRITRIDNIHLTNPGYTTSQAIKYGILMAFAAGIIASVLIIILDKSDKRLRDTEVITRKFNVPLLGVVPTIEELKADQQGKKKTNRSSEVK